MADAQRNVVKTSFLKDFPYGTRGRDVEADRIKKAVPVAERNCAERNSERTSVVISN